jgi:adenylate cyclase class 2
MHHALLAMGFRPTVRIVKVRRTASVDDVMLCVDELEGVGVFLELERMVRGDIPGEAVQAELSRFVASLGVEVEWAGQTYDTLVRATLAAV